MNNRYPLDPRHVQVQIVKEQPLGRRRDPRVRIVLTAEQQQALARYAARWNLPVETLVANVLDAWIAYHDAQGEPVQLELPTTAALDRLARKAQAARRALLDLVRLRNNPAPNAPTPKEVM
jgi:hypothetical protein